MSRRLHWTRRALRRLDQIGEYIAREDPGAAAKVVARLVAAAERLALRPAMGRIGRIDGTRELIFADLPYILPYRVTEDSVDILSVIHTSQRWPDTL